MRIGKLLADPRRHRIDDLRCDRGRGLVIEIDHAASDLLRALIRRHSVRKRCTSLSLVEGPKLTRIAEVATSAGTPMAPSTRLVFMLPEEQALPADTEIPARSS